MAERVVIYLKMICEDDHER